MQYHAHILHMFKYVNFYNKQILIVICLYSNIVSDYFCKQKNVMELN